MPSLFGFKKKSDSHNEEQGFENRLLHSAEVVDVHPALSRDSLIEEITSPKKKKRKVSFGKIISLLLIVTALVSGTAAIITYSALSNTTSFLGQGDGDQDLFGQIGQIGNILNFTKRTELKGEKEGRTNVLLIGKDATGAGLTDTIMIASYYYKEKKIVTVNIPRDFYVSDGFGSYKINSVYPFAEGRKSGSGEAFLADFLSKEFGIPIHYWASINFNALKQVVDTIGGIEVNVDKDLVDCLYPTDNYSGYIRPCPSFKAGKQQMDGRTALIYSRSRETTSDFDRSRRQSIVVQAILEKIKSQNMFDNATKINSYLGVLRENFRTSLKLDELVAFGQLLNDMPSLSDSFLRVVWDTSNGFLCSSTTQDGAYIITYCGGAIAGRKSVSRARSTAQNVVQNLLQSAQSSELFDSNAVFVGNLSDDTQKAFNEFDKLGFTNIRINNTYPLIDKATAKSVEKISIYIPNDKLRSLFEELSTKPNIDYSLKSTLPEDKKLPPAFKEADIIVWVSPE